MPETRPSVPELLAPAGDWECLRAAVSNGADAVYFGLPQFNARLRAENFTREDLPEVMNFLHAHGVKGFVAFNTLIFTGELEAATEQLRLIQAAEVDAIIVQDLGLAWLAARVTPGLHVHASTQMTVTSPEGVEFAKELGVKRVVLARELSLREMERFDREAMPLEVFVHGALCVAYSGQCLTSESLGQRSANRGECAQACRMPYELIVDGKEEPLGDRRYLLSPQDLSGIEQVPQLIALGIESFKIEGRLKSPEYVAAVTQVYRKAIDAALEGQFKGVSEEEKYQLEMVFSRGLYSGWLHGVNHQELVPARFGKKRGVYLGRVTRVGDNYVECALEGGVSNGDGIVFDRGGDTDKEEGGRVFEVRGNRLFFRRDAVDFRKVKSGDRIWKTDDPELNRKLRQSFSGRIEAHRPKRQLDFVVEGSEGSPLKLTAVTGEQKAQADSKMVLQAAQRCPLEESQLRNSLGRLGDTPFELGLVEVRLDGKLILPLGELNRLRRETVSALLEESRIEMPATALSELMPTRSFSSESNAELHVLCRTVEQIETAMECGITVIYADFEDIRKYPDAVRVVREKPGVEIALATPRIQKAGEQGFFKLITQAEPDAVLVRNLGGISYFRNAGVRMTGDFSLNVANPLTAQVLMSHGLERVTISYDLNFEQVLDLVTQSPADWFELTIHQHMPMFHMEHCVFAAFLSEGTDYTNCGRPCESHDVRLRDRVGMEHPLKADVGCRNTVFNSLAQTGAQFYDRLSAAGLRSYRVELLLQKASECRRVIGLYQKLLSGEKQGAELWRELQARAQLGVTRGTYGTGC